MNRSRTLAAGALAATLAGSLGCLSLAPEHRRPDLPLPEAWSGADGAGTAPAGEIPDDWWRLFGDPALDALVDEALAANQDLAAAVARVDEARALAGLARADRFPELTLDASGSRTQFSGDNPQIPPGVPREFDVYRAALAVSWELDFWGRLRSASEAARAELLATEQARRSVRLTVAAETASAYFDLLALDRQRRVTIDTLGTRTEAARLQGLRFDAGTISELDLAQARAEVAAAEATVPAIDRLRRQAENRLAVLLGRIGGTIERGATLDALGAPAVPVGLPSRLLERRPDVLGAELRLAAARARIGAARAGYFPSFSLTGYGGSESSELSDLLGSGTSVWQAALGLVQPIFNAGRTRRQVEAARARERLASAGYLKTVQVAFAEVEDGLVARRTSVDERAALSRLVDSRRRSRELSDIRYEAGESSFLEVLDADRELFRAELDLARARRDELQSAVDLFRALGGGWSAAAPAETAAVPAPN
jgi:multidrug efflux system outer membrane protein